jgi:hypothetical protein
MNLLAPISPHGWSALLPERPVAHQFQSYEGFQYLGAGFIGLLIVGAVVALTTRTTRTTRPRAFVLPLVIVCVLAALYALSPRITFGERVLADWTTPAIDRLAFFRASGRFFWPMTYLLLTGGIAVVVARLRATVALAILLIAIALQMVDLRPAHAERRATSRSEAFHSWPRQLVSPAWAVVLPHYKHLLLVPASQCGGAPLEHEEAAYLAGLYGLTINSGLGARWDDSARRRYCGALDMAVSNGDADDDSVYIVTRVYEERLRAAAKRPVVCGNLDVARLCVTAASYERWRDALPMSE